MNYISSLVLVVLFFTASLCQGQPQLQKWYMNYYEVDFSAATPQFSALPFSHNSNLGVSQNRLANVGNGIHDGSGNLLFYTVWDNTNPVSVGYRHQVYNSSGGFIGNIVVESDAWEITVVPYGDVAPDKYLIIYPAQRGAGATRYLDYVIIDMAANSGQGSMSPSYEIIAAGAGSPTPASAVSKPLGDPNGSRYLYVSAQNDLYKFDIDFTLDMMGYPELVVNPASGSDLYSFSQILYISELDLSQDGTKLALGETFENDVHVLELDSDGDFSSVQSFAIGTSVAFNEYISGLEFDASGDKLFVNFSRPNDCPPASDEGIYVINLLGNTVSAAPIPSTMEYSRSSLEMAFDGYIYAGGYFKDDEESRLARIDPAAETMLAAYVLPDILPYVGDHRGYSCSPAYPGFFTLPDQVDGEIVVGQREVFYTQQLDVFPNPGAERIVISLPESFIGKQHWVTIYDALGNVVGEQFLHPGEVQINMHQFSAGFYTLMIRNGEAWGTAKFVKQ